MAEKASRKATDIPTGTVTFLFTDIESSTAMWERDPVRMQEALTRHDEILRESVEANGGYVFKTVGDAFCAAFTTARQALEATAAAQRALFAEEWSETTTVRVRMALHTGATEERDGDYFGPPVNRVARLLSAGHGGQILLSAVTYGLVRDNLSFLEPGADLRDLGEHRLKDLRYSECIYQLVIPNLPSEFPSLKTLDTRSSERYSLTKLIGSGGMAEVYLAHDEELDRNVALKILRSQYAGDEKFVERFKREAKNAASLSHPNIVQVYDRGETKDGAYYMVLEWVSGGTLNEHILKEGPLPTPAAVALTLQVARALQVAHERGVVHRDIKPQNILLTRSVEVKVADFGIARAAASSTMTEAGVIVGTPHYISPEQALGEPASPQSDLYSLGVVLYEMLTGEVPYYAETPVGIAMKHVSGKLRPPKEVNPDIPEEINAVTLRLLARDPKDRYQSTTELIEDLERVERGQPPALAAPQQDANPASSAPVSPSADSENVQLNGFPPLQSPSHEPAGIPAGPPPPAHPGGGEAGDGQPRRRKVPRALAAGLAGVALLLGVAIVAFMLVPYLGGGNADTETAALSEESSTPGYVLVKDNSGRLSVEVPSEWSDTDGTAWDFMGGKIGLSIIATTDLQAWYHNHYYQESSGEIDETPGMLFGMSRSLIDRYPENTEDQILGLNEYDYSDKCEYGEREEYDDGNYQGKYDLWRNCGETNAEAIVLVALPENRAHVVLIQVVAGTEADLEAQKHVLDTFKVSG